MSSSDLPRRAAQAFARVRQTLRLDRLMSPLLALGIGIALLFVFQHLSETVDYKSVIRNLRHLTLGEWAGALGATALSYVALVARDAIGLRYVGASVPRIPLWIGT
ncbi:hypothetical protein PPH41_20250, partial [Burkholderia gladioli]|nr:hypothetical protein [Burkholderia gladioli]